MNQQLLLRDSGVYHVEIWWQLLVTFIYTCHFAEIGDELTCSIFIEYFKHLAGFELVYISIERPYRFSFIFNLLKCLSTNRVIGSLDKDVFQKSGHVFIHVKLLFWLVIVKVAWIWTKGIGPFFDKHLLKSLVSIFDINALFQIWCCAHRVFVLDNICFGIIIFLRFAIYHGTIRNLVQDLFLLI